MSIYFHAEDIGYGLRGKRKRKRWIGDICEAEQKQAGEINIIFTTDRRLLEINRKFLKKDVLTDVIAFDYGSGNIVSGDVFISLERVRENAEKYCVNEEEEMMRVMAHGILHLAGYRDKDEKEMKIMKEKENECLRLYAGKRR